mgnify:FL=1
MRSAWRGAKQRQGQFGTLNDLPRLLVHAHDDATIDKLGLADRHDARRGPPV